jgi:hypothetical protein
MPADYSAELPADLLNVLQRTTNLPPDAAAGVVDQILAAVSVYRKDRARETNGAVIRGWLEDTATKAAEFRAWLEAGPPPRAKLHADFVRELDAEAKSTRIELEHLVGWISMCHDPWKPSHRAPDYTRMSLDNDIGVTLFQTGIRPTRAPDGAFVSVLQMVYGDLEEIWSPERGARDAVKTHKEWRRVAK